MGEKVRNLYLVTLKGMTFSLASVQVYGVAYVIASDPTKAVSIVQDRLEGEKIGFASDRVLDSVQLMAEDVKCPGCGYRLYIEE